MGKVTDHIALKLHIHCYGGAAQLGVSNGAALRIAQAAKARNIGRKFQNAPRINFVQHRQTLTKLNLPLTKVISHSI